MTDKTPPQWAMDAAGNIIDIVWPQLDGMARADAVRRVSAIIAEAAAGAVGDVGLEHAMEAAEARRDETAEELAEAVDNIDTLTDTQTEVVEVLELAQLWLANSTPATIPNAPYPPPRIAALLAKLKANP